MMLRSITSIPVISQLRKDIMMRKYADRTALKELTLAKTYQCSRAALRNAFFKLEKEGLITVGTNGTRYVSSLTEDDIFNLYDLRRYIELTAVKQHFSRKKKDLSGVLDSVNEIVNSQGKSLDEIIDIDSRFHRNVIGLSGNKAIDQAWDNISDVIQAVFHLNMTSSELYEIEFLDHFTERHLALFNALMTDEGDCIAKYQKHIEDAMNTSLKAIKK
ncbi:MAG: hypothetical protein BGN88_13445 [Clostridiales bacterium 43-6]|nr:MAG: hypothetical protein BGN88_13445 [Clostridiales bacterium 43-6]